MDDPQTPSAASAPRRAKRQLVACVFLATALLGLAALAVLGSTSLAMEPSGQPVSPGATQPSLCAAAGEALAAPCPAQASPAMRPGPLATPTATPTPARYTLRISISPFYSMGRVTQIPPPEADGRYEAGVQVTLIAYPPVRTYKCLHVPYWSFTGWGGDVSGNWHVTSLVMVGDKSAYASFREYFPPTCTPSPTPTSTVTPAATPQSLQAYLPMIIKVAAATSP